MSQLKGRCFACVVLAGLVPLAQAADSYAAAVPSTTFIIGQATQPATVGPVTYTPIRRLVEPRAPAAAPASAAAIAPKSSASPLPPRPAYFAAPIPFPVSAPVPASPVARASTEPAAVASGRAIGPSRPGRPYLGLGTDVGMPDGLTLGLVLSPADWLRISAALGTTSLSDPELLGLYRGGLVLVPLGWGPSFSFEAGRRR